MKTLSKGFYERDPALVAKDMLGKILVRRLNREILSGKIVETEAYYGEKDPASKAYKGRKIFNELMFMDEGEMRLSEVFIRTFRLVHVQAAYLPLKFLFWEA